MASRIGDVAAIAGVSIKSVSRVLNDEPHVSDKLRERVRAAVKELDYVPSPTARALRSSRTYTIHLVTLSVRSNFHHEIQFGALSAGERSGYRLIVSMLGENEASDPAFVRRWAEDIVRNGKPDGMILVPPMASDADFATIAEEMGIPLARIGPNDIDDGQHTVLINDRAGAAMITRHLIERGHDRIGFVWGKPDQVSAHERFAGFSEAMSLAGLPVDERYIRQGHFEFECGLAAGDSLLSLPEPPTAIFASNDDMAAGIVVAAHRRSVAVPEQLAVAGFDNAEIAEKMWPALTTIRQPLRELGAAAMQHLMTCRPSDPPRATSRQRLDFELIVRQSTAPSRDPRPR